MQETGRLFSCCPSVLYKNGEKRNSIKCTLGAFLHLLLRPIFRQLHPNFINVRTAYASKIRAHLTKKSSHKIKYKKIPRVHQNLKGGFYMKITFIGATHEVTGSCYYLEAAGHKFLVDCGMEQGPDYYENAEIPSGFGRDRICSSDTCTYRSLR